MKLDDILDLDLLETNVEAGWISRRYHPDDDNYAILNYSDKCAYEAHWDETTTQARGLIYNTRSGEILARPFRKFFNYGQAGCPEVTTDTPVIVTDKQDGSLGILYKAPDGDYAIATRGSFESDQAKHATAVWREKYRRYIVNHGHTMLFEIIYPGNRIVVDYKDLDDLVLLGGVDIATGASINLKTYHDWPGPRTTTYFFDTFAEALAAEPRPNAEGLVVHLPETDERLKLKQADYVALHRIVTGLTARKVWQWIVDGKQFLDLIEPLPDEFQTWATKVWYDLHIDSFFEMTRIESEYDALPEFDNRRDFALHVKDHPDRWAMFLLKDGKFIRDEVLKRMKPAAFLTPARTFSEDTA